MGNFVSDLRMFHLSDGDLYIVVEGNLPVNGWNQEKPSHIWPGLQLTTTALIQNSCCFVLHWRPNQLGHGEPCFHWQNIWEQLEQWPQNRPIGTDSVHVDLNRLMIAPWAYRVTSWVAWCILYKARLSNKADVFCTRIDWALQDILSKSFLNLCL